MTFDWEKMRQGKRVAREDLAARAIVEKLALLDVLRERALALRGVNSFASSVDSDQSNGKSADAASVEPPATSGAKTEMGA